MLRITLSLGLALLVASSAEYNTGLKAAETTVLRDATVFDSASGQMLPHRTIVVSGELIQAIGSLEQPLEIPADARTIDCAGRFVIPGLIDAHVHLVHLADRTHVTGDEQLPLYLAAGVTSVRSAGDAIVAEAGIANFSQANPQRCARVFLASPLIDGATPFHRDVGFSLVDVNEVPAFIEEMAAWNVTTLKMYVGTPRHIGRAVIELGHRHGMVVTGHLGAYSVPDAVEDGIDCLEHIGPIFNARAEALVTAVAQHRVAVDPTLVVYRNMLELHDLPEVQEHPDLKLVPAGMRRYWEQYRETHPLSEATRETRRQEFSKYLEFTGTLYRAGVPILAGTDAPEPFVTPGFSLHQELELLVASGLSPAAALQAATLNNAKILHQADKLRRIEPGMLADLLILRADPLVDIRHTRQIELILRGGQVVEPETLLGREAR